MKGINIKYLLTVLIIMCLLVGSSCLLPSTDTSSPPDSSPTDSTSTPIDPDWTPPAVENQAPALPSIADVVALVKPSVVAINTEYVTYIFNQPYEEEGAGSGWIIDEDGLIVTNNHVVEGANSVTVTLSDGRTFPAETIRTDWLSDLAIIKVNAHNLPAAKVGDSDMLRVGDWVVAIGNSLGMGISATKGIVSANGVSLSVSAGQTLDDLIQTDAAINPGNSGGPLVNMAGEVIGITSVKVAQVGVEGMGYAISSNTATPIIQQLVQNGYVVRPWLGVVLYTVDQYAVLRYGLAVDKGALITEMAVGSPVDEAGIEPGDVITEFAGEEITTADDLIQAIHSSQIGQEVEIVFWRGDVKNTTYAILTESPPPS
ncbi:MAG: trypsin-like peptidase domain-containing protein [Dehalococcoidales bacterium]|nr:trypsin-like peptidase domain-containing protein [Dehalococcoidales bacterium]